MQQKVIFDFDSDADTRKWTVVDDGVMGGKSSGKFTLDAEGHAVFRGEVSLENNGGFSSVRYRFKQISTKGFSKCVLRIKGDGKTYQFRVKAKASDYYSYTRAFSTSNQWETIEIPLDAMYPTFRGRTLDFENYNKDGIEEIAILIGNKKAEDFELRIERISLQ